MTPTNRTQPVLVGGLVMGVMSALPFIGALNVCCCLWVVAGGVVASYLLQQSQPTPITPADGALVGLLAGLVGAAINLIVAIPIDFLMSPVQQAMLDWAGSQAAAMPPALREIFEEASTRRSTSGVAFILVQRVVWFVVMLVIGAIFSTLGGVLGAAIFKKPLQTQGVIDVPPSTGGSSGA